MKNSSPFFAQICAAYNLPHSRYSLFEFTARESLLISLTCLYRMYALPMTYRTEWAVLKTRGAEELEMELYS